VKTKSVLPLSEYRKLSDEEVVHRYVHRHEPQAMNALYERYAHLVLGICLFLLHDTKKAQEATRQVFTGLLEDLKRSEINDFKSWLIPYIRNYCRKNFGSSTEIDASKLVLSNVDESALPERDILLSRLEAALSLFPKQQETCLRAFYLQRNSIREIARQSGMNLQEIKSLIRNGRNRILRTFHLINTNDSVQK